MSNFDVIVIGGGPSGLMASVAAAEHGASVLLIDKGAKLGRKLGISGGGRCNVTNVKERDELISYIPGNGRFLYSAFDHFNNQDIIAFFEGLGIALKEEDNGRMFPVSDKASSVVSALINQVRSLGVQIMTDSPVSHVIYEEGAVKGVQLGSGKTISSAAVIIATGGKSVPQTGSTGDGYPWAEAAGHTITELFPTEVPIISREAWIKSGELQGLSLRDVALTVWNQKGKKVISHRGDMIFTHFGLSGPIALRCSQFLRQVQRKSGTDTVEMSIDLFPDLNLQEVESLLQDKLDQEPKKAIRNSLKGLLPERLIPLLLAKADLDGDITGHHVSKNGLLALAGILKRMPVNVHGTRSLSEAFVTGGGVNLKEIDPKRMESKLMQGLFFCGEVLDIHGYTGGYNITAAFSTGYTAGKHAADLRLS
ncbi:aminoacetone oxidase family FAD-binding enzyme [Paenibacillus sp. VTT E-133280]|uniref:NAD(P)/FAD-dependent oxidoreductase n=1 Tax=Paenibacillus sp. VTT E-133280 TaxID=1986222 RepID=UPI000B9FB247|nr:NAD(P)/FAD-dependent oxidoreductase [Paenibacillus sp. VTT E-133280]OZQ65574.1 aminoacetone oxidase family FAD-binding enzyme [Paenibacillus sp. VTT E-133280]